MVEGREGNLNGKLAIYSKFGSTRYDANPSAGKVWSSLAVLPRVRIRGGIMVEANVICRNQ